MNFSRIVRVALVAAGALALFAFSWLLRYNDPEGSFAGLLDDHYFYLVRGWQMLHGEWPDRDFVDIGAPLTFALSAAAQLIGGPGTLPELVLCVTLLSLSAALSFYAAEGASGSVLAAAGATFFQIALSPRFYNYGKLISYALAIPALWAVIDRPTWPRRIALGVITVVALLLRHDHGVFVGLLVAVTLLCTSWSWSQKIREALQYAAVVVALTIPYLVYLQVTGGIVVHFVTANAWSMRDRGRAPLRFPAFEWTGLDGGWLTLADANLTSSSFYLLVLLPFVGAACLWASRDAWRPGWNQARAKLAGVTVLALVLNIGFLRGALAARLADVAVPHTILIAWLLVVAVAALRHGRIAVRALTAATVALVVASIVVPLSFAMVTRLGRSHISLDPGEVVGRAQEITIRLRDTWPLERWAAPSANPPMALAFYLNACTEPAQRVFVSQYMPQVPALAQRAFAGGHPDLRPGFFSTEHDQALFVDRIRRQDVPVLIVPAAEEYAQFADEFPLVDEYFRAEYEPIGDRTLDERTVVGVRVRRGAAMHGRYEPLDLPCFAAAKSRMVQSQRR